PRVDVREDRRFDEVALSEIGAAERAPVAEDLRAGSLPLLVLGADFPELGFVDDRPHLHPRLEAVARAPGVRLLHEQTVEVGEDRTCHDRTARRSAALTGRAECADRDRLDRLLEVGI